MEKPYERILSFWFGRSADETKEHASRWWKKDPAFDQEVRSEFEADLLRATRGELDGWLEEPAGSVAFVVLLDQFSRNMYRDTPEAFAQDERALAATLRGLERGFDARVSPLQRYFFYMPMMHAEDRAVQRRSVEIFERLAREKDTGFDGMLRGAADYARRHHDIVERFGRFPHRNCVLERTTTGDESEFLLTPGSSF
ncbi:MAG TPA: DUF924 family protein [Polyangiaceae bacterium]|nr:DUF924 family protein [Polyangiaceae bacterium]